MKITETRKQKTYSLDAKEIALDGLGCLKSRLAQKIALAVVDTEKYPKQIAKELKENEQKIYYHIRNLEKAGVLNVEKQEMVHGANAKFYRVAEPALVLRFKELVPKQEISAVDENVSNFLAPFIIHGKFDARIIVGSPDPHGPEKARSRDGYYGIDLALFFGTFLNYVPEINVRLDTDVTPEELKENLILIGGPITNQIVAKVNEQLPIYFAPDKTIYSRISKTAYSSDETGVIVKIKNPFNPEKAVLVVAGKRFSGTRAAITAFLKGFRDIYSGNRLRPGIIAKVVEGLDLDSDGVVDAVEFRE
ncbi:S-layer protein [Candidatus Woesearchaeota archaeon]|nr:S-layer protein [Candidatus Woesearchaeota archaeon]